MMHFIHFQLAAVGKGYVGSVLKSVDHISYIRPINFPEAINRIPGPSVVSKQIAVSGTQGICFPLGETATNSYGTCYIHFHGDFKGQLKP